MKKEIENRNLGTLITSDRIKNMWASSTKNKTNQRSPTLVCMCRPSSFASLLRLAFGLKLQQQFLCVSQLAFAQPYPLPAHLVSQPFSLRFLSTILTIMRDPYKAVILERLERSKGARSLWIDVVFGYQVWKRRPQTQVYTISS